MTPSIRYDRTTPDELQGEFRVSGFRCYAPERLSAPFSRWACCPRVVPQDELMLDIPRIPQTYITILLLPLVVLA
jgi:hypothetical protein